MSLIITCFCWVFLGIIIYLILDRIEPFEFDTYEEVATAIVLTIILTPVILVCVMYRGIKKIIKKGDKQ